MSGCVVVTGASRGIGAAVSVELVKRGFEIVGISRTAPSADLGWREGDGMKWLQADVSKYECLERAAFQLPKGLKIRGLVLNAGWGEWYSACETPIEAWIAMLETNLLGAVYSTQVFACKPFVLVDGFQIIAISSDSALYPFKNRAAYCVSKAALAMYVACLREEMRERGHRVTELVMSRVNTGFRNKNPGHRPDSLEPQQVAGVIAHLFETPLQLEFRRIELSSVNSLFGI